MGYRKGKDLPLECSRAHVTDTGIGKLFLIGMAGDAVCAQEWGTNSHLLVYTRWYPRRATACIDFVP